MIGNLEFVLLVKVGLEYSIIEQKINYKLQSPILVQLTQESYLAKSLESVLLITSVKAT